MASALVLAAALKSPIRLLAAVTVVPPDKDIPFTTELAAVNVPFWETSQILLRFKFTVEPAVTEIPFAIGAVVPVPDKPLILLSFTFVNVAAVIAIPTIADDAPVEESVVIIFPLIFILLFQTIAIV